MLEEIKSLTSKAGAMLLEAGKTNYKTSSKEGRGEYVTQWDLTIQNLLKEGLLKLCPEAGFLGEEDGNTAESGSLPELESGYCFIVDPIDGTNNFIRGFRHSAVSVALSYKKEIICGAVSNPYQGELFYAEKGKGAFCQRNGYANSSGSSSGSVGNEEALRVIPRPLKESVVIFGTSSYDRSFTEPTFTLLRAFFDRAEDLRNGGSAALDICYIAAGRGDVFFEFQLCPWDYAAASLILTEAGGFIETLDGKTPPLKGKSSIIASNGPLLKEIKSLGLKGIDI